MNKKLEKKLIDKFPSFFKDMYGDPIKTCMAWGCDCGDGWYKIIRNTCNKIAKIDEGKFRFLQIKEKFGGLNLYCAGCNEKISKIIRKAEDESYKVCEKCGSKEEITVEGNWIQTLCKTCRK